MSQQITISKSHKVEGKMINWASDISVTESAGEIFEQEGHRFFKTKRNYYYGATSDQKLHYENMSAEGSSAQWYVDIYAEIAPNIFIYISIATDTCWDNAMTKVIKRISSANPEQINLLKNNLFRIH